jgi:plastocyanin
VGWTLLGSKNAVGVAAAFALAFAGVVLSSCFSERQATTAPLTGECKIPTSAAGTVVVVIQNFAFVPELVTVKRGTTVTWVNCDAAASLDSHTSTSDGAAWSSPTLRSGQTYSRTFNDAAGTTLGYHCVPHPFMKASIYVE